MPSNGLDHSAKIGCQNQFSKNNPSMGDPCEYVNRKIAFVLALPLLQASHSAWNSRGFLRDTQSRQIRFGDAKTLDRRSPAGLRIDRDDSPAKPHVARGHVEFGWPAR